MNKKIRLHPFDILGGMRRYLFILVVPLVRGFGTAGGGVNAWIKGAWIDLAALTVIVALGVFRWKRSYVTVTETSVRYTRGLILRYTDIYIVGHISTIRLTRPLYIRPFRAAVVKLYSLGKTRREFRPLILPLDRAEELCAFLSSGRPCGFCGGGRVAVKPDYADVAFTSAASSTIIGGIAFLYALLSNLGQLLGASLAGQGYGVFASVARFFAFGMPPVLLMVPLGVLLLYFLAFLQKLSTYYHITITRGRDTLGVAGGLFGKYQYALRAPAISSVDFRCRLLLRLFKRYSAVIGIPGYGGGGFMPVLIPSAPLFGNVREQRKLLPEFNGYYCPLRPDEKSFRLNNALPFAALAFCFAAAAAAGGVWLRGFKTFAVVWGSVFSAWFSWVAVNKAYAAPRTGLGFHKKHLCAMYESRRVFHRVILPKDKIVAISTRQDPIQRHRGTCRVDIYERGIRAKRHRVYAMPFRTVKENIDGMCREAE